jgi:UrcA family protein
MKTTTQNIIRSAALLGIGLFGAGASHAQVSSATVKLSLSGLDLSTPEGMSTARERVHQAARSLCGEVADDLDLSHRENFLKCVDTTIAQGLEQIPGPKLAGSRSSAVKQVPAAPIPTGAGSAADIRKAVSFTDLDLSTPAGARAAHERLHEVARKLCGQAAEEQDLSHQANFVKCVDDAMARALPQIEDLARQDAARRSTPSASVVRNVR